MDWHRLFGLLLTDFFTGSPYVVELEKDLSIKQQFLDVVVLRKRNGGHGQHQKFSEPGNCHRSSRQQPDNHGRSALMHAVAHQCGLSVLLSVHRE